MNAVATRTPVFAATVAATAMIAHQVGGKATRDAFFLSNFNVTSLPVMVMVTAAVSVVLIFMTTRAMTRLGPARLVPAGFAVSAVLHAAEWGLAAPLPRIAAVAVYLHTAVFGLILISGFWSLITERFDPRTARRRMARIATGSTLGGLLGGIIAERVGSAFDVAAMLPVLTVLHLLCAGTAWRFAVSTHRPGAARTDTAPTGIRYGLRTLTEVPYLRHLALLVGLGTLGATLVDYVFKAEATSVYTDPERLIRFFAMFYTGVSLITFLTQTGLSRYFLNRLGLARTVATLPAMLSGTSLAALVVPGLGSVVLARGGESVIRSSLFRSGYELHYTPVPKDRKRATKTLVDVGFERLGDGLGAGFVALVLLAAPGPARVVLLTVACALGVASFFIIHSLQRGYVRTLEENLLTHAVDLDMDDVSDTTTRGTLLKTLSGIRLDPGLLKGAGAGTGSGSGSAAVHPPRTPGGFGGTGREHASPAHAPSDPVIQQLADLRSADPARIQAALKRKPLETVLVPQVVRLLAWDAVSERSVRALSGVGPSITGQLADALLNPEEEFAIRRRVPRVLATFESERATAVLFRGLNDKRFEVRFQCGRALARLQAKGVKVPVSPDAVYGAVLNEVHVDRRVWEGRRLLERMDDSRESLFVDEVLRDRANRSLEHVFTVLSLTLPREPLRIAFRGLHTTDPALRGTALEYLESVLPDQVRRSLWPFLETPRAAPAAAPKASALEDLLKSSESIQINLAKLRRKKEK